MKKMIGYGLVAMVVYYGVYETVRMIGSATYKIGSATIKTIKKIRSEKKKEEMAKKDVYVTYFVD